MPLFSFWLLSFSPCLSILKCHIFLHYCYLGSSSSFDTLSSVLFSVFVCELFLTPFASEPSSNSIFHYLRFIWAVEKNETTFRSGWRSRVANIEVEWEERNERSSRLNTVRVIVIRPNLRSFSIKPFLNSSNRSLEPLHLSCRRVGIKKFRVI